MSLTSYASLLFATTFLFLTSCSEEPDKLTVDHGTSTQSEMSPSQAIQQHSLPSPAKATIKTTELQSLKQGEEFIFKGADQEPIVISIDTRHVNSDGTTSLSGTHKGEKGSYQLTATAGESITFGRIQAPKTTYTFTIKAGKTTLVDLNGPGTALVPKLRDDAVVPQIHTENNTSNTEPSNSITPTMVSSAPSISGKTTIDLMIVYSDGFATEYPGDALTTRLSYLVTFANTLYANSNIDIYLRIVHTVQSSYPDDTSNSSALSAMRPIEINDPVDDVFSEIESLRQQHGADLVSFIRPYDKDNHNGCGIAYLFKDNSGFTPYGYSVVSDGSETSGSYTYYCSEQSLAHELGHNMGSAHDRDNAKDYYGNLVPGAYSYSYGFGISDNFGTVMSYIKPEIDYFSNPDITCDAGPPAIACGLSEDLANSANNALSLNNTATSVASFMSAKYSADVDGDGETNSTDTLKALILLSGNAITGTVDSLQDIDNDGKLGLAEAIYSLQNSKE
ncbi:M12 family metallo-peptidase [Desulforhopalus sp. 52FAK]